MDERIYVPGVFKCPKCSLRLVHSILNAQDGTVRPKIDSIDNECPTCGTTMWRVSWKDEAMENLTIAESQLERALIAEKKLEAIKKLLGQLDS